MAEYQGWRVVIADTTGIEEPIIMDTRQDPRNVAFRLRRMLTDRWRVIIQEPE